LINSSESLTTSLNPAGLQRTPLVLVGIVTRNRAGILPKAIQSALSQSYSNLRVAVLDDCSEDNTWALRAYFPGVLWHRWEFGCGYLEARNQLMQNDSIDYYVSLDDDAWFIEGDEIAVAISALEDKPRVAAVAFDILSPDRPRPIARSTPRSVAMFIGCGHMLRMSAVRESGFYVPSPGPYGSEEKDLCIRLLDRGWDIHLLDGVHVWHDKSMVARDQPAQHRSGVCNDLVFALRRCPLPLLLMVLPIKLLNHLRFSFNHGLVRPCLAGFGLFFRHAFAVLGSRDPVHAETFGEFIRRSHKV
jgi:glycosyltransferase involved in cell wall biosynthesis